MLKNKPLGGLVKIYNSTVDSRNIDSTVSTGLLLYLMIDI